MSAIAFARQLARMTGLAELNIGHISGSDYQKERDSDGEVAILVPALAHLRSLSFSTPAASVEYRKLELDSLQKLKSLAAMTSFGLSSRAILLRLHAAQAGQAISHRQTQAAGGPQP